VESEIRVLVDGAIASDGESGATGVVISAVRDRYPSLCGHGALPCADLGCADGMYLSNGARLYDDHSYAEYSTPECADTADAVAAVRAGDWIIRRAEEEARKAAGGGPRVAAYRNNRDYAPEPHSCGAHINVRMTRAGFERIFADEEVLHGFVIPFFVSLPVLCGGGSIADLGSGKDDFVIWQRAPFLKDLVALQTVYDRPLINTRDESLDADPERYARFHIISFDANVSEVAEFCKLGLLRLLCAAIDAGRIDVARELSDPMSAVRSVARDPFGLLSLASKQTTTPIDLLRSYLAAFKRMNADGIFTGRVPDAGKILKCASDTLARLERDPLDLVGVLDWPTKFAWLEQIRGRRGLTWSDPLLKWMDVRYHGLTDGGGPPAELQRITTDAQILRLVGNPPTGSRAEIRGLVIRKFGREIACADWAFVVSNRNDTVYVFPDESPPAALRRLEAAEDLEAAARALGLTPTAIDLAPRGAGD
jgi:proteasome accessory factor A